MKAIIISDHECRALLDRLSLVAAEARPNLNGATPEGLKGAHGIYHYEVVRWLQEMGADVNTRGAP